MSIRFDEKDILSACGATYSARGRNYHRQNKVLMLEWEPQGSSFLSRVSGSGKTAYKQIVRFVPSAGGIRILGVCSCPMMSNCKHIAAALYECLHQQKPESHDAKKKPGNSPVNQWLKMLDNRMASSRRMEPSSAPAPATEAILYLLSPRYSVGGPMIALEICRSRLLKKGGWGKPTSLNQYQLSQFSSHSPYGSYGYSSALMSMLSAQDKEILRMIQGLEATASTMQLGAELGALVLQQIVATGRCFLQDAGGSPLIAGPPLAATFRWDMGPDGYRLRVSLEELSDEWLLVPTRPPAYIDPANGTCGLLKQELDPVLFDALRSLPPVPEKELPKLARHLLPMASPQALAMPVELEIEEHREPPVPVLELFAEGGSHRARLLFDYGPFRLRPWAPNEERTTLLEKNKRTWRIERFPEIELGCRKQLEDLGMELAFPAGVGDPDETDLLFTGRNVAESAMGWREFLQQQLPRLSQEGWRIEMRESFALRFETAEVLSARIEEQSGGWFDIGLDLELDGETVALLPLIVQALERGADLSRGILICAGENRWLEIPAAVVKPVLKTLFELFQSPALGSSGEMKLHRSLAPWLMELTRRAEAAGSRLQWQGGQGIRELGERLRNFDGIRPVEPPQGLQAQLRPYQLLGLSWLQFLREYGFGGILADDMGLGKTVQALAHLLLEKESGRLHRPALAVAPTSVLGNWAREAARFAPGLKVLLLQGPERKIWFDRLEEFDLVLTSYPLLSRDGDILCRHDWTWLILDEAQNIKNAKSRAAQILCSLKGEHRLCLTGTPMENHLGELWSLLHFLMPGFLGQESGFNALFRNPIEKKGDNLRRQELVRRISPFVLRRDKEMVASELPPKSEMVQTVELEGPQRRLYESIRVAMADKVGELLSRKGLARSHIEMLDALLKLRQVCCDPRLVKLESARNVGKSAKLDMLLEMLEPLLEDGRRILLFSQFTAMLGLIEEELKKRRIDYLKLTGQTRKRQEMIDRFQSGEVPLFLISLKAGGVGLNLTAADTVIHYDPWWNPAVERQATDRAHRIGQDKPVFVYKLVATDTVEEKILRLQQRKQELADGIYGKGKEEEALPALSAEEILSLFSA